AFANEEGCRLALMRMRTGDESVAALDLVHQPVGQEEVERPIDGDWRRARSAHSHALDDLIGAGRLVALRHAIEHIPALRGEPRAAALANALGALHEIGGAMIVVVTGIGE